MRSFKAVTFYYMLPFSIYIFFSSLEASSPQRFWGMIFIGSFFAIIGFFLMQNALKEEVPQAPLNISEEPIFKKEEGEMIKPIPTVIIDRSKEKEWEEKLHSKENEMLLLQKQLTSLQEELSLSAQQLKSREESIKELHFEVRSLLAISRGKNAPITY